MREAFKDKQYGFFFHFLNTGSSFAPPTTGGQVSSPIEEWDKKVDAFDVKKVAKQLHELKAGYAFLTLGQNSGYYCTPNSTYDTTLGVRRTSRRDLVSDFADELAKYGIDLYLYTTSQAPMGDNLAIEKLQGLPPWDSNKNYGNYQKVKHLAGKDPRLTFFINKWNDIHREWALRWGNKIKGWWVDGCYFPDKMYDFPKPPNGQSFMDALRAGNPDAVVAFNPGATPPPRRNYPNSDEDYTAGEINNPQLNILHGPRIDGLQYHILTFVGSFWGLGPVRGTGAELAAMTRNITDTGGVVSWDVPFSTDGIEPDLFKVLKDMATSYYDSIEKFPPIFAQITAPEGTKEGILKVESKAKFTAEMEWFGKTTQIKIPGTFKLSPAAKGEVNLKIKYNGFERCYPVWCGQQTIDLRDGKSQTFDNGVNAKFTLQSKRGVLYVTADVKEKESRLAPCTAPWGGSTLEIYLHTFDDEAKTATTRNQFAVQPDGTRVRILPTFKKMASVPITKTKYGYRYTFPIKTGAKSFILDLRMQTYAGHERDFRPRNLFGGTNAGATSKDKHALILI